MNTTRKILCIVLLAGTGLCAWAQDGVTDTKIVIGQTIGVTGTIAGPVKEMMEGANAYIQSVNDRGGINGRKIELRVLDDKFDPKLAAENAEALIKNQHVFALFQSRGTPHTQAMLPILEANQVPLIAPSTGAMVFHKPVNHLLFNVRPQYQAEVAKAIEHLDTIGLKDIGFLHVDDTFGLDGLEGFNQTMAARHLTPTIITKFARVKPDYATVAASIVKANPKAVIIVSSSSNTIEVIKAIRAQGGKMQLLTLSNNSSQGFIKDLGEAGHGVIITQVTPPPHMISTTLGQEFRAAAKVTGATVSYAAMEGFVGAKVLVEGLRRAGRNLTRVTFIQAMETMQRVDLGGMTVNYSGSNHSGSEFVELTMITKSGRLAR
jgi:branched-chain amino acid transport system substrate-binding protein